MNTSADHRHSVRVQRSILSAASGRKAHQFPNSSSLTCCILSSSIHRIYDREIVRIIARKFGYQTNHRIVKQFLVQHTIPMQLSLERTTFHQFEDALPGMGVAPYRSDFSHTLTPG